MGLIDLSREENWSLPVIPCCGHFQMVHSIFISGLNQCSVDGGRLTTRKDEVSHGLIHLVYSRSVKWWFHGSLSWTYQCRLPAHIIPLLSVPSLTLRNNSV
jgi:hypothetical protein